MSIEKAQKLDKRFLNEKPKGKLSEKGIWTKLVNALSEDDLEKMIDENIFFAGIVSPGSHGELIGLPKSSSVFLITFDIDALEFFTPDEYTALLLHEIGHSFNPNKHNRDGEFSADDFAHSKGFGEFIISGLQKGIENKKVGFDVPINKERIERIKRIPKDKKEGTA